MIIIIPMMNFHSDKNKRDAMRSQERRMSDLRIPIWPLRYLRISVAIKQLSMQNKLKFSDN